jgi:hypothetical protein
MEAALRMVGMRAHQNQVVATIAAGSPGRGVMVYTEVPSISACYFTMQHRKIVSTAAP